MAQNLEQIETSKKDDLERKLDRLDCLRDLRTNIVVAGTALLTAPPLAALTPYIYNKIEPSTASELYAVTMLGSIATIVTGLGLAAATKVYCALKNLQ